MQITYGTTAALYVKQSLYTKRKNTKYLQHNAFTTPEKKLMIHDKTKICCFTASINYRSMYKIGPSHAIVFCSTK